MGVVTTPLTTSGAGVAGKSNNGMEVFVSEYLFLEVLR